MKRWWIAALGVAAVVVWLVPSEPSRGAGPFSFPHQPHISDALVEAGLRAASAAANGRPQRGGGGTVDSECRVCHDFTKGPEAHLDGCATCHIGDQYLQVEQTPAPATTRSVFPHAAHLASGELTCFSCHRTQVEEDWVEFSVPPPSLGPRGVDGRPGGPLLEETCADCHAEHEPGGAVAQDDVTGDGKQCSACHMGARQILPIAYRYDRPTTDVRPFRHEDHGGATGTCEACHGDIRSSRSIWDYDPTLATVEKCVGCHISDAEGTPLIGLATPARATKLPYVDFSNFPHAAHLADPKGEIEVSGKVTAGCQTCHYPETDVEASKLFPGRPASGEPVGRAQLVDYRACEPCHQAWKCENHGVGAWACFKCHSGMPDSEGNLPIASAEVSRDEVTSVRFTTVHHPGITSRGAPVKEMTGGDASKKACSDCHVGDLDELQSRLQGKGFAHEPHVSGEAANVECLVCHPTAATTSWSEDLQRFEARVGGSGTVVGGADAKGCLECHVGASPAELGLAKKDRIVPQFDHKAHVSSDGYHAIVSGIACTECHVEGGDVGYQVPADVADCTKCHSHDPKATVKFERTGPASSEGESKLCLHCHDQVRKDGENPPRETRTRTHLDLLPGTQFHDKTGACAACHERDGLAGSRSDYRERISTARVKSSIHDDTSQRDAWFNDPRIKDAGVDPQGRTCMSCHRREPQGYLRSLVR